MRDLGITALAVLNIYTMSDRSHECWAGSLAAPFHFVAATAALFWLTRTK